MSVFTIQGAVNIDTLTPKTGQDTYNINGGYLTVDQDSRFGLNQGVSGATGNITLSAVSGGTIEFNSTKVRLMPFNSGAGWVPAFNTLITQGNGASSKLIGVYSGLTASPHPTGTTMPASGFIKVKQWNDIPYTAGTVVGITATTTSADFAGWLEIVGADSFTATVNRLNTFKVRGEWYYFTGVTTSGIRSTAYQIPTNGAIVYLPGVWVETGSTTDVYEFYPCAGTLSATSTTVQVDPMRGKVCWISTAGQVRFGHDGTNSTGGYLPPSGLKIRIPNIFFMCCTTAALGVNALPNATLATRYDFTTNGGGLIDIDKAMLNWYPSFNQPYSVALSATGIMTELLCTEIASPIAWRDIGVGQEAANTQIALSLATCFAGGVMDNCTWSRAAQAGSGAYVNSLTDLDGFIINNEKSFSLVKAGNATTGTATLIRVANSSWNNSIFGGGRMFLTTCTNLEFHDTVYFDNIARTTAATIPMFVYDIGTNCSDILFDGVAFSGASYQNVAFSGTSLLQPYSGILNVGSAGCSNIKLRNLGSATYPLDLGGSRVDTATWTRATTTATVTSTNHGLSTGDLIYVIVSSDIRAISVASKSITVTNVNTFTFSCTNSGNASGTLNYYPTISANLFVLVTGAAANTVKIQRCYTPHTRTNLYTSDNSSKNVILENVVGDFVNVPLTPQLNGYQKGVWATPSLAAQTSCYGTHWLDVYTTGIPSMVSGVTWVRTGTTAIVATTGHTMRTGDFINVEVTSDATAIVKGQKTISSARTQNDIAFDCLSAGATTGTLTFTPLTGRMGLLMNEATLDTEDNYVIESGGTAFTSAGGLYMPTIMDTILFETPYYTIGHTGFPIAEPVMAGGTIANYNLTYAIDKNDGNGYSSFKNLHYKSAGGGGSNGSATVTMTSTSGISVGDYIWGTNIGFNAKVTGVTSSTAITVDIVNRGVVSGVLSLNQLPSETLSSIDASLGFKMKVRIQTQVINGASITSLYWYTNNTTTSRAYQYPLDPVDVTFTFDTLQDNSEVRIYRTADDVELAGVENSTSAFTYSYEYVGTDVSAYARIHHLNYDWLTYENLVLSNVDQTIPVQQRLDRYYENP